MAGRNRPGKKPSSPKANGKPSRKKQPVEATSPLIESISLPSEVEGAGEIPSEVTDRMVRRVVVFCGIPTFLGLSSFGINYYLITHEVLALPPYFTLVETLGLFGLGFVGITYGVLSASWEPMPGSVLGLAEFRTNLGLVIQQWREQAARKRLDT